jgi:hypothetical protein
MPDIAAKAEMRRVSGCFSWEMAYPLPIECWIVSNSFFNYDQMKNILLRNFNLYGILTFLAVFHIFHTLRHYLSPQLFPTPDNPGSQQDKLSVVAFFAIPESFNPYYLTGVLDTFCDIIHFQQDRLYPFSKCYVYRAMKDYFIKSNDFLNM